MPYKDKEGIESYKGFDQAQKQLDLTRDYKQYIDLPFTSGPNL